jgi:hypothetical protein
MSAWGRNFRRAVPGGARTGSAVHVDRSSPWQRRKNPQPIARQLDTSIFAKCLWVRPCAIVRAAPARALSSRSPQRPWPIEPSVLPDGPAARRCRRPIDRREPAPAAAEWRSLHLAPARPPRASRAAARRGAPRTAREGNPARAAHRRRGRAGSAATRAQASREARARRCPADRTRTPALSQNLRRGFARRPRSAGAPASRRSAQRRAASRASAEGLAQKASSTSASVSSSSSGALAAKSHERNGPMDPSSPTGVSSNSGTACPPRTPRSSIARCGRSGQ